MSATTGADLTVLRGRRILVVEDEYIIACEIADLLSDAGADVLGPVPDVGAAMQLIAQEQLIDGALLDVNLKNERVWPIADALRARHVPVVLATGYDKDAIPAAYS